MHEYLLRERKAYREMLAKENARQIGLKLSLGMDFISAIEATASEVKKRDKAAFLAAVTRIKTGATVDEALKDRTLNLLPRDKYVLSLDIPDQSKGEILIAWSESSKSDARNDLNLFVLLAPVVIYSMTIIGIFELIVPQLRDLCVGGGVFEFMPNWATCLGDIFYGLYESKLYFLFPFLAFGIIATTIYSLGGAFNVKRLKEEAELLNLISMVDKEEQWKYIGYLSNRVCFPKSFHSFKRLSLVVATDGRAEENIGDSGVSPYLAWLLQLSLYDNSREFLKEGAVLLKEKVNLERLILSRVADLMAAFFGGLLYLSLALYMFGTINGIMTGSMSL